MEKFYRETQSGNIVQEVITFAETSLKELQELHANITDAAQEKHVPVVSVEGNRVEVSVGSVAHPMLEEHYIAGIFIETVYGSQLHRLHPGEEPKATFLLADGDTLIAAYEYCNLHGLWKAAVEE